MIALYVHYAPNKRTNAGAGWNIRFVPKADKAQSAPPFNGNIVVGS